LSLQTARLQLADCIARPSTAVIELRRARSGLLALLRALRTYRRETRGPMARIQVRVPPRSGLGLDRRAA
jgi:hypothetical protein